VATADDDCVVFVHLRRNSSIRAFISNAGLCFISVSLSESSVPPW